MNIALVAALVLIVVFSACVQRFTDATEGTPTIIGTNPANATANTTTLEETISANETTNTTVPEGKIIEQQYKYLAYVSLNSTSYYKLDNENYTGRLRCSNENIPGTSGNCELWLASLNSSITPEEAEMHLNERFASFGLLPENKTIGIELKKTDEYIFIFREEWATCQKDPECIEVTNVLACCDEKTSAVNVNFEDTYYQEYNKGHSNIIRTCPATLALCQRTSRMMIPRCVNNRCILVGVAERTAIGGGEAITRTIANETFIVTFIGAVNETVAAVKVDGVRKDIANGKSEVFGSLDVFVEDVYMLSKVDQTQNSAKLLLGRELAKRLLNLTCPDVESINCTPALSPEQVPYCRGAYAIWITENCPNISRSY